MFPYWLQVNVALAADGPGRAEHAHELFCRLTGAFTELRAEPEPGFLGCFFQRKPPDLRLRLALDTRSTNRHHDAVRNSIERALVDARDDGRITEWWWSDYEPEVERFGGIHAMAAAHNHFCRDAAGWHRVEVALREVTPTLDPAERRGHLDAMRVAASNAFVAQAFEDFGGRRDVWNRLLELTSEAGPMQPRALMSDGAVAGAIDPLLDLLPLDLVVAMLDEARAAGVECRRGSPGVNPPDLGGTEADRHRRAVELVALVVHFDCNRWGVDGAGQHWMAQALCPPA